METKENVLQAFTRVRIIMLDDIVSDKYTNGTFEGPLRLVCFISTTEISKKKKKTLITVIINFYWNSNVFNC